MEKVAELAGFRRARGSARSLRSIARFGLLWLLLVMICVGLGYGSLARYDPASAPGLSDATSYAKMVTSDLRTVDGRYKNRVLVPLMARVPYRYVRNRIGGWNQVELSILIVDSMFVAATGVGLAAIALAIGTTPETALIAALLYLLTFAVSNFQLAGMIDSGEGFVLAALALSLEFGTFWLLPILSLVGALAKETTPPLLLAFSLGWWLASRSGPRKLSLLYWTVISGVLGISTVCAIWSATSGHLVTPQQISGGAETHGSLLRALAHCLDRGFWYFFGWLMPLGLFGLWRLPRQLVAGSASAAGLALLLGVYCDAGGGNAGRAVFDAMGFVLVLSCAMTLTKWLPAVRRGPQLD